MKRVRVLVTGMGSELGTRVTNLLEASDAVGDIVGLDIDPPRRRLSRAEFHRIDPRARRKAVDLVRSFDPEVVVHLGVFEPNARSYPEPARISTAASVVSVLGAAVHCPSLKQLIVRSGIEVYGRARGAATRPDELVTPNPTTPFGRSLLHVEDTAIDAGLAADVPVTLLRFAPVVGPSVSSPLGRYLRLPIVPVSALSDMPFALLHQEDAAEATMAALDSAWDGPVNVVGSGAVTAGQAVRMGNRLPVFVAGPAWTLVRVAAELFSAPLPPHVRELLVRGRGADGGLASSALGVAPRATTDVVKELYEWGTVAYLAADGEIAA